MILEEMRGSIFFQLIPKQIKLIKVPVTKYISYLELSKLNIAAVSVGLMCLWGKDISERTDPHSDI